MAIKVGGSGMVIVASTKKPAVHAPLLKHWLSQLIPGVTCRAQGSVLLTAVPAHSLEAGNLAQVWSLIATLLVAPIPLHIESVQISTGNEKQFGKPGFGIHGVRELLGVKKRPIIGGIIGTTARPAEHAAMAYRAWIHGADIVRDSCLLIPPSRTFVSRLGLIMASKRRAEQHTGERKLFAPNITSGMLSLLTRAHACALEGCEAVIMNSFGTGIPALQAITDAKTQVVIADPCGFDVFARPCERGISRVVIQYLHSLAGTDILCGGRRSVSECNVGSASFHKPCLSAIEVRAIREVPFMIKHSRDIMLEASNTMSIAGLRQAVEASMHDIPLDWYASVHNELRNDLRKGQRATACR